MAGEIYLRIAPDRVVQYDYGYDINGEAFENAQRTRPHDLTQYDTVEMKYSRKGADTTNIARGPVIVGEGAGNENKFTWRIPEGTLFFPGLFNFYITMRSEGLSRTSLFATFLITESAVLEEDPA